MAAASRFVEISKEILDNLLDNSIPEKTKRAIKYGMKIFNGKFSGLLLLLLFFFFQAISVMLLIALKFYPVYFLENGYDCPRCNRVISLE